MQHRGCEKSPSFSVGKRAKKTKDDKVSICKENEKRKRLIIILVRFEKKHTPHLFGIMKMESELSDIIGRPVDLKTPNDLSSYFRKEVLTKAKTIYGK